MKLLICTQAVDKNDPALGFFHRWIEELAGRWGRVMVICLYEGAYALPANVTVLSLGKESRAPRLKYLWRFYRFIITYCRQYDVVLVHMNPEYLVLGGWWWKLLGKKTGLWYSHKSITMGLRIAVAFADTVFTTAAKSVTFKSRKLRVMGHGIEVERYRCAVRMENTKPIILTVGRVTKIKHCETLIEASSLLKKEGFPCQSVIAGGPVNDGDRMYEKELRALAKKMEVVDTVEFTGPLPLEELSARYCRADISVNMVPTGGLDKSVLEGMAAGNLVISSNEVFREHFGAYADRLIFKTGDAKELAKKISALWRAPDREAVRNFLLKKAAEFDVQLFIERLSAELRHS